MSANLGINARKGKGSLAQRLNLDPEAMHGQLREHRFKVGDKVRYVGKHYPAINNEDGMIENYAPQTDVLTNTFMSVLEGYVNYVRLRLFEHHHVRICIHAIPYQGS
jgi:hypothetical protein